MTSTETSKEHQENKLLKMLLINQHKVSKKKTAELQSLTVDYNNICLTVTHLDYTVQSKSIMADPKKTVFSGEVLIAFGSDLNHNQLTVSTGKEIIAVKTDPKIIISCYYRSHVYMQNINRNCQ